MPTYVLMTRLGPDSLHDAKGRRSVGKAWMEKVRKACPEVNWLAHYAILGPYDFMDIYEAPDEETAAKVSMIGMQNGAFQAESLTAIPYKRFVELTKEI